MRIPAPPFLACVICIFLALTGMGQSQGVQHIKTSYKHYSIFSYQGRDVLCEPYIVQKNDWLYKIFKKKGEISEQDFPLFISIFKQLNPHIHNIDTITTGTRILIPLKIIDKNDYTVDREGNIKIPVVEFHDTVESAESLVSFSEYTIAPGDTISALLDPVFLNKGGSITRKGQTLFYQLNPHIKNIHRIHPGDRVKIPVPSTQKIPSDPPATDTPPQTTTAISSIQLQRLQDYANAINGRLIHQGKLYFPGRNGQKQVELDLSATPVIETKEPPKTVLILSHQSPQNPLQNKAVRQTISSYWKHMKIQPIETIFHNRVQLKPEPSFPEHHLSREQTFQILTHAGYDHIPEETIRFHVNQIPVSARLDRVKIPNRPDLLLNFGTVYGQGIDAIEQMAFKVVSFSSKQDRQKQIQHLLSALGYQVWHNPSFTYQGTVETLAGVYGEQSSNRVFISSSPITPVIRSFLETRQIQHVFLQP
jgi:hypothetical protein